MLNIGMKRMRSLLTAVAVLFLIGALINLGSTSGSTRLYVDPPSVLGAVGGTFTVDIMVEDVEDLFTWQVMMMWTSSALTCNGVVYSDFMKQAREGSVMGRDAPPLEFNDCKPTDHAITGGVSVTTPGNAYDNNVATAAYFRYDPSTAGTFEVKDFTTPVADPIDHVDFKMRYSAGAGGAGEEYRIVYYVGTSGPVVLQDWTGAAHAVATEVWEDQTEPDDGEWSWTDVSSIRFIVETKTGADDSAFNEYEAWVTAYAWDLNAVYVAGHIERFDTGLSVRIYDDNNSEDNEISSIVGNKLMLTTDLQHNYTTADHGQVDTYPGTQPGTHIENDYGYLMAGELTKMQAAGVDGSGWLATIEFLVLSETACTLDISGSYPAYTYLIDSMNTKMACTVEDGHYVLPWAEDMNVDGIIDIFDIACVGIHWGETGSAGWIREDVVEDGVIDIEDLSAISIKFGEHYAG